MKEILYLTIISLVLSVFACNTPNEQKQKQEQKQKASFSDFIATLDTITLPLEIDCEFQIEPADSVFSHKYQDYISGGHTVLGIINTSDSCYFVLSGFTLKKYGQYLALKSYKPKGKTRDFEFLSDGCYNHRAFTSGYKILIREDLTIEIEKTDCIPDYILTKEDIEPVIAYETTSKLLRLSEDGMIYTLWEQKTRKSDEHNKLGITPVFDQE